MIALCCISRQFIIVTTFFCEKDANAFLGSWYVEGVQKKSSLAENLAITKSPQFLYYFYETWGK